MPGMERAGASGQWSVASDPRLAPKSAANQGHPVPRQTTKVLLTTLPEWGTQFALRSLCFTSSLIAVSPWLDETRAH